MTRPVTVTCSGRAVDVSCGRVMWTYDGPVRDLRQQPVQRRRLLDGGSQLGDQPGQQLVRVRPDGVEPRAYGGPLSPRAGATAAAAEAAAMDPGGRRVLGRGGGTRPPRARNRAARAPPSGHVSDMSCPRVEDMPLAAGRVDHAPSAREGRTAAPLAAPPPRPRHRHRPPPPPAAAARESSRARRAAPAARASPRRPSPSRRVPPPPS